MGTGGFDVLDVVSALTVPALKPIWYDEPQADLNVRAFTGFTHDRSTGALQDAALTAREWAVEVVDLNVLASDYVLTDAEGADRPAETDYVRMAWLLTTRLNSEAGVAAGVIPNANTVTMEATDYRGRYAADVAAECSEAARKLWFIYDYGAGKKLYYDLATGTSLSSSAKISDTAGDPNGSTVWQVQSVKVKRSPDRIYSKIHLTYNGGTVILSDAGTASAYRTREAHVLDASISDVTLATVKAQALLDGAQSEIVEIEGLNIVLPAANVNDIRQGQRVEIKLTRHGIGSYTWHRVVRRTLQPLGTTHYHVALGLASDVLASANGARGNDEIWPHSSNANDDGATVIVDRAGLSIIDGALTVVNAGGTTIIDGTSNMFKILATGTLDISIAAWTTGALETDSSSITLSGLGTFTEPPAFLSIITMGLATSTNRFSGHSFTVGVSASPVYVALTSGGSPVARVMAEEARADVSTKLDGSDQAVVLLFGYSASGTAKDVYARYHVLFEASI